MIELKDICKSYRVARRETGFGNAVKSLFKREYNMIHAINHISFTINDGEMVGYIGPNGAGKSSTIKILSGILTPDSGTCRVNDQVPWKDRTEYVRQIGVVFGQRSQLWWDIPVMDSFKLLQAIYAISEPRFRSKLDELTQLLQLEELLKTPTRQLSLGQRMRCEIAASLLHEPKLLFLDEPTIGLDAVSKIAVRSFIKQLNEDHKITVILTTHDMQDIEAIAKRVILIGRGQKLMDGTLEDLRLEAETVKSEMKGVDKDTSMDIDHIIASLYAKLNIV
ncbi:MAG: ATP-binding cassette domain-containing protein [Lachnospiraceae bacterium]|nr:ATP-binding cassette domain-containing protein [Lachnospiraceae bacterium]